MALTVLLGATLTQAAVITSLNDTFGDGNIATNPDDGNGWVFSSNDVGGQQGSLSEAGGQATLATAAINNNGSVMTSNDQIDLTATDTLTVTWDIASVTSYGQQGVGGKMGDVEWRVRGEGSGLAEFGVNNGSTWLFFLTDGVGGVGEIAAADVKDGFTVTLTADADGLQINTSGLGAAADAADISRGYGGSTFLAEMDNGAITTRIQGNASGSTINVNSITATIPEPATLGLVSAFAAGTLFVRRRFMI